VLRMKDHRFIAVDKTYPCIECGEAFMHPVHESRRRDEELRDWLHATAPKPTKLQAKRGYA
jgi:hypothetical protein